MSSTKFVVFVSSEKQDGHPGLGVAETFWTSSLKTVEWNAMQLDRKEDLKVLYQVCVFGVDRKTKMATLSSDWLRYIFFVCSTSSLQQLKGIQQNFSGWSKIPDGQPGLWLAETFSTSLKPLNGIQRNVAVSKISMSFTKFVCVFQADRKSKMAALASDKLRYLTSSLNLLNGIQWNLSGSKI